MEKIENTNKCAHIECQCQSRISDEYCSDYCRKARESNIGGTCNCGHPECGKGIKTINK